MTQPLDTLGRPVRDLRISVTDRCNFRCTYCMPKEIFGPEYRFLSRDEKLTYEEITRVAGLFAERGVTKLRLTGGEPLLRREIEKLIAMLAGVGGIDDLTLTTNASLLARKAETLKEAGLMRVTVSLDALDDPTFMAMNDVDYPVETVLEGIKVASDAGLGPIKINAVVQRGVNEHAVVDLARYFRGTGHIVRFIEYMDVGTTNGWRLDDVVPALEMIEAVNQEFPLEPLQPNYVGEVAKRYRYKDGGGEIGVIASVTQPFCGDCTRVRLSPDGSIFTCLFSGSGTDLKEPIREGASDMEIGEIIDRVWAKRADRYSEIRSSQTVSIGQRVEMSYIGG
ncbi:MAG: GTP 3',8-cyclase MoaA [Actinobacteria bacterium]|nr:MAG: GTP 3',8-cyclase MoaA [Actinomycetota bacterium]